MKAVIYIHGQFGSPDEADHYRSLFPGYDMIGLDYKGTKPWETAEEIKEAIAEYRSSYDEIIVIANSIGAYYLMNAGVERDVDHAYFISPIVDMEKLITDMMLWANVSEEELQEKEIIQQENGEDLSWEYLCYVGKHPLSWHVPTDILYGSRDFLTSIETITSFASEYNASLTIMEDGEHWFHTSQQMAFLDWWISSLKQE